MYFDVRVSDVWLLLVVLMQGKIGQTKKINRSGSKGRYIESKII